MIYSTVTVSYITDHQGLQDKTRSQNLHSDAFDWQHVTVYQPSFAFKHAPKCQHVHSVWREGRLDTCKHVALMSVCVRRFTINGDLRSPVCFPVINCYPKPWKLPPSILWCGTDSKRSKKKRRKMTHSHGVRVKYRSTFGCPFNKKTH